MRFQAQRGTEDVLPSESHRWLRLEHEFRTLAERYGYREIRTPTFEDFELFVRTSGETSDVVSKEMYDFVDKGGRHVALKPEGTAPAMRAVIEHNLCPPGHVQRLSYVTPCFRYGRPQKGRLRELHQCGLELVGSASPGADAEVIELTSRFYDQIGIGRVTVLLNSIGREECRERYRAVILQHFEGYLKDQGEEQRAKAEKNPLRLLDSKDAATFEIKAAIPPILEFLEDESKANFETLQQLLIEAGVEFQIDSSIVRGLDYYTDTVFEITSDKLGAQSSLCGGGRYDNLIKQLGGPPTPAVGVGIGIERALLVLQELGTDWEAPRPDVYVVQATPDAASATRKLVRTLREAGLIALQDLDSRSMKSQLKQADNAGARFAAILGEEELAAGKVTLRDLSSSQQESVPSEQVLQRVKESQ